MKQLSGHGGLLLYLDFDGVLHHHDVWWRERVGPYMRAPGDYTLFEHLPVLERMLKPYPQVRIVLSTSWVLRYGRAKAAKQLGPRLRQRVIGATFHSRMDQVLFSALPRGKQVWDDVQRRKPKDWLALDDDPQGWPPEGAENFIQTDEKDGISEPAAYLKFQSALERLCLGIPMDFPREAFPMGTKGVESTAAQRSLRSMHLLMTAREVRQLRYRTCVEIAEKLTTHCRWELASQPRQSRDELLQWLDAAVLIEAPAMSLLEQAWCLVQVRRQLWQ